MNHDVAKKVFERIRNQPYLVTTEQGEVAPNCFFKGCQLIHELSILGYGVRGRTAEMDWTRTPLPLEILDLIPDDILQLHFFPEVLIENEWRMLDPSIDPATARIGFHMNEFDKRKQECFKLTKVYELEEQIVVFNRISQPSYQKHYFERTRPFLLAVNAWLVRERRGHKAFIDL